MLIQKISPNLRNGTLISLYNNIPVIFECFHGQQDSQRREKPSRKYQTRHSQNGQIVLLSSSSSFSSSSSSDNLAQHCLNLLGCFCTKQQHFQPSSATTHRFFATSKSSPGNAAAHSITMASFLTPFSRLYACAFKRSLSNVT